MRASSLNCGDAYIIAYDHPDSLRPPFLVCSFASVLQAIAQPSQFCERRHNRSFAQHVSSQPCVRRAAVLKVSSAYTAHRLSIAAASAAALQAGTRSAATMGEKMGPNTLAAFHAGADFMQAKLAAEEDDSSDDEALLAGAPMESYGQARRKELEQAAERRNKPPGAVLVDPTACVDSSSHGERPVGPRKLDHPPNPKCEATLEALESIPISRRGGCELRRVEAKFCS